MCHYRGRDRSSKSFAPNLKRGIFYSRDKLKKYGTHQQYDSLLHLLLYLEFMEMEDPMVHISVKMKYFRLEVAKSISLMMFTRKEDEGNTPFIGLSRQVNNYS